MTRSITSIFATAAAIGCFSTAAVAQDQMRMKVSSFIPEVHMLTQMTKNYLADLEAASDGTISLDYFGSEALGKATEQFDLTVEGLADMGVGCMVYTPSRFPLFGMLELPFFTTSSVVGTRLAWEIGAHDALKEEFSEVKFLLPVVPSPSQIFANKRIEKVEDFEGMRMVGIGPVFNKAFELMDVQSVSMGYPDTYLALERGTIEGGPLSWAASTGWKWQEVVEHPININLMGGFACGIFMNKDSWAKLSPEMQAKWDEVAVKHSKIMAETYDANDAKAIEVWEGLGKTAIEFPEAEREKLAELLKPVWVDWIETNEKAGRPASELYQIYVKTMEELGEPVLIDLPEYK